VYYFRRRLPGTWYGDVATCLRTKSFAEARWLAEKVGSHLREHLRGISLHARGHSGVFPRHLKEALEDSRKKLLRAPYAPSLDAESEFSQRLGRNDLTSVSAMKATWRTA